MSIPRCMLLLLVLLLAVAGCGHDPVSEPAVPTSSPDLVDPAMAAAEVMTVSGWRYHPDAQVPENAAGVDLDALLWLDDWSREELPGGVAHYSYEMQVGPGQYDRIVIHRVVKETSPGRPIHTDLCMFLQHGDAVGFVKFLFGPAAPSAPDDHAAATFLAQNDVDVWGIDQNWVLVPEDAAEFGFLEDWGMDNQIANLRSALAVARYTRYFAGDGFRKMPLLGYSSGGWLGFAYVNDEAARPRKDRHVMGFVNADAYYKLDEDMEDARLLNCADAAYFTEERAAGNYEWWIGFEEVGRYALDDPAGDSPIFDGFTNEQVALYFGCAGWRDYPLNPWWHYWGGLFDGDPEDPESLPIDTRFLPKEWSWEFMATAAFWQPNAFFLNYNQITCDEEDVPWDDHLAEITVPILNLGGAGGLAPSADHTLSLLGSTDIEHVIVQLLPDDQKFEDYGHIDIWTSTDAAALVWQPMLDWIVDHTVPEDDDLHPIGNSMN